MMDTAPPSAVALPDVAQQHVWRGRDLAFFGGMFFVLLISAAVLQSVIYMFVVDANTRVIVSLTLTIFLEGALLGSTYFLVRHVYGLSYRSEMRLTRNYRISSRSLVLIGAGLAASVIVVSGFVSTLFPDLIPEEETALEQLLATPQAIALYLIFGVAVAPALEELMFRGFLFRVLQDLLGLQVAVWTTAALFAVAHMGQLWPNLPAIIVILAVGYVLSKLRERTHSVVPGFIVHTVYNAVLFLMFAVASFVESSAA